MATKRFNVGTATLLNGPWGALFEPSQTLGTRADGWTVGKIAANNSSDYLAGTKQATGTFSTEAGTPKPSATLGTNNAFVTPYFFNGTFANTDWVFDFHMRATVASAQQGRILMRVFKSADFAGVGATQLTSAVVVGTTATPITSADSSSIVTWSPGGTITLNNEWLFFALAWEIIVASGSNTADAALRAGTNTPAGSGLVTPDYTFKARPYPGVDSGYGHN